MCRWNNIEYKDMMLPKSEMVCVYNIYKFHDGHIEIDTNILFHRLVVLAQQEATVVDRFSYELTPYPAALLGSSPTCLL